MRTTKRKQIIIIITIANDIDDATGILRRKICVREPEKINFANRLTKICILCIYSIIISIHFLQHGVLAGFQKDAQLF